MARLVESVRAGRAISVTGVSGGLRAVALACAGGGRVLRTIVVVPDEDDAAILVADIPAASGGALSAAAFPDRGVPSGHGLDPSPERAAQRSAVLERLADAADADPFVVVATATAALERLVPPAHAAASRVQMRCGESGDPISLGGALERAGYVRDIEVRRVGQWAARGGILDLWPSAGAPVRIEFEGDTVATIRLLDPESQLSEGESGRDSVVAPFLMLPHTAERLDEAGRVRRAFPNSGGLFEWAKAAEAGAVVFVEPRRCFERMARDRDRSSAARRGEAADLDRWAGLELDRALRDLRACTASVVSLSLLAQSLSELPADEEIRVDSRSLDLFFRNPPLFAARLQHFRATGQRVCVLADRPAEADAVESLLREIGHPCVTDERAEPDSGDPVLLPLRLSSGFHLPGASLVVVSQAELWGTVRRRAAAESRRKRGPAVDALDLKPGDALVHDQHGVGRFVGIARLTVDGHERDFLQAEYADGERLYVPVTDLALVSRYIGSESPRLSKLGGAAWAKARERAAASVRELADALLAVQAERRARQGHAFAPDSLLQQEFEDAFPYEETEGQLRAIGEVKSDMERTAPMDRIVCGDVGYGKTEVALRAACKAAVDGKQVAVVCPTTLLADQHLRTFRARFERFPVRVAALSRLVPNDEQRKILRDLAAGAVDIVIGTHRLLSADVHFRDLGLLIVDEEHRFGVEQKEQIKRLRAVVDVLTLTATPIPRTLHMGLAGLRDVSLIESPPPDRLPVETHVTEWSDEIVRDAVVRELARGGQVFHVRNRVRGLRETAERAAALVPEAKVVAAHGQMDERVLVRTMEEFLGRQHDVLVCTTIVESGLDIPNANTLIVQDAHRLGLAQLYQLRGRVGRSGRQAYALFFYARDHALSETAQRRLAAIEEFTEMGAGFRIALKDMEIRGAGNLLGPEQHGHLEAVGFDLYLRLLDEAVRGRRGEETVEEPAVQVELKVDAFLPEDFVADPSARLTLYRRLSAAAEPADVDRIEGEIGDRFGELPRAARTLVAVARLRALAFARRIAGIASDADVVWLRARPDFDAPAKRIEEFLRVQRGRAVVVPGAIGLRREGRTDADMVAILASAIEALSPSQE